MLGLIKIVFQLNNKNWGYCNFYWHDCDDCFGRCWNRNAKEIKDKISAFEGDISIQSFNNTINENSINPFTHIEFLEDLRKFRGVRKF